MCKNLQRCRKKIRLPVLSSVPRIGRRDLFFSQLLCPRRGVAFDLLLDERDQVAILL
jgi:hypothetical protein